MFQKKKDKKCLKWHCGRTITSRLDTHDIQQYQNVGGNTALKFVLDRQQPIVTKIN